VEKGMIREGVVEKKKKSKGIGGRRREKVCRSYWTVETTNVGCVSRVRGYV